LVDRLVGAVAAGDEERSSVEAPLLAPRALAKSAIREDLRFFSLQYGLSGQKVKTVGQACGHWYPGTGQGGDNALYLRQSVLHDSPA